MDYKKSYYLLNTGGFFSIILLLIATHQSSPLKGILAAIGFITILLNIAQSLVFCHCPICGQHISTREKLPQYCPECGNKLEP